MNIVGVKYGMLCRYVYSFCDIRYSQWYEMQFIKYTVIKYMNLYRNIYICIYI